MIKILTNKMHFISFQIFCLAWHPDGKYLATFCKDRKIRIYDPVNDVEVLRVSFLLLFCFSVKIVFLFSYCYAE